MTIHEFTRYVPLGSKISVHYLSSVAGGKNCSVQGTVTEYIINSVDEKENKSADEKKIEKKIRLKTADNGSTQTIDVGDIAYVEIISPPEDYGQSPSGWTSATANRMFNKLNEYRECKQDVNTHFQLKDEFGSEVERIITLLENRGQSAAAGQIRSIATKTQCQRMDGQVFADIINALSHARNRAEEENSEDRFGLRRAEVILYSFAHAQYKKCGAEYCLTGYDAIYLLSTNLIEGENRVLPLDSYHDRLGQETQAFDWFLLATVYNRCMMQESCTYAALVQSVLHRGKLFLNRQNLKIFCRVCGNAHDFTLLGKILSRCRQEYTGESSREYLSYDVLLSLGKMMCWMLYQLGDAACLDGDGLLPVVVSQSPLSNRQIQELQEQMLCLTYKYRARNRNDRFQAVTEAMRQILEQGNQMGMTAEAYDRMAGYIYEFHGTRGMELTEVNGHILGTDLVPYRFNYGLYDHRSYSLVSELRSIYDENRENGSRTLVAAEFVPLPDDGANFRFGATGLVLVPGGIVTI